MAFLRQFGRLGGEWEFFNREGGDTPTISVSPQSITIPHVGTAQEVSVTSNTYWTVLQGMVTKNIKWNIGDGYIHLSANGGKGDTIINISSDANSGGGRSQEIEFVATSVDGTQVTKKLTVHQKANLSVVGYDGEWADTTDSEYVNALDCETADSIYVTGVDILADGGSANIR